MIEDLHFAVFSVAVIDSKGWVSKSLNNKLLLYAVECDKWISVITGTSWTYARK